MHCLLLNLVPTGTQSACLCSSSPWPGAACWRRRARGSCRATLGAQPPPPPPLPPSSLDGPAALEWATSRAAVAAVLGGGGSGGGGGTAAEEEADLLLRRGFGWTTQAYWRESLVEGVPSSSEVAGVLGHLQGELMIQGDALIEVCVSSNILSGFTFTARNSWWLK